MSKKHPPVQHTLIPKRSLARVEHSLSAKLHRSASRQAARDEGIGLEPSCIKAIQETRFEIEHYSVNFW
jgi:hypothetical protein